MKRALILFMSCICVFLLANPGNSARRCNFQGKVLKTEKLTGNCPQIQHLNRLTATQLNNPEPLIFADLSYQPIGTIELKAGKMQHFLAESGLEVAFLEPAGLTLRFLRGNLGKIDDFSMNMKYTMKKSLHAHLSETAQTDVQGALGWLTKFSQEIGLEDGGKEFIVKDYTIDNLGKRHIRFQQVYQDIPVWAEELYFHIDRSNQIYAINGCYESTPSQLQQLEPALTADEAFQITRSYLRAKKYYFSISPENKKQWKIPETIIEKAIWFDLNKEPHLIWFLDLYANPYDWFYVFIDARTGEVLHHIHNRFSDGFVNASGYDLYGVSKQFRAHQEGNSYLLLSDENEFRILSDKEYDGGLEILDFRNQTIEDETAKIYSVISANQHSWDDPSSVSAMSNVKLVYDYYKNTHNRRGIDDQASTIYSVVNVMEEGEPMDNAFWSGVAMFWGNGNIAFTPLAGALDITAHEFTHGVTEHTAGLIYEFQSGALNEAISDFFAAMVDRDDWYIGEDVIRPEYGIALRDMYNPSNPLVFDRLPVSMDEYQYLDIEDDHGGVHTNCGIINRASVLIAEKIGRAKTEQIYYRALTTYLTRQSEFIDARLALEQAAADKYGTAEVNAVKSAFDAVKIFSGKGFDATKDNLQASRGGNTWIAFIRDDLQIGIYSPDSDQSYYLPGMKVKTKEENGSIVNYSQITVTATGQQLYFVNEAGKIVQVDLSKIETEQKFGHVTFDDIYIKNSGDIWNAAVTRDNAMLAFTSIYENDRNVYFYINNTIYSLELDLPATQEGISINTIQYADVLDWSPNCRYRKLAFDAYNEMQSNSGETIDWWSIGEIDFYSDENILIYPLLPPQPKGYSAGNVEYSSCNPDIIAFNYMDPEHHWDLKIYNYETPQNSKWIKFPVRKIQRPAFSPDDKFIVIDRYSDDKLLIYNIEQNTYREITSISTGARYSEWFILNPTFFDLEVTYSPNSSPTDFYLNQNYPNPFNPTTTIEFALPKTQHVTLKVFDLQGCEVANLVDETKSAGIHRIQFNASSLPSGVYFYQIGTERFKDSKKFILLK